MPASTLTREPVTVALGAPGELPMAFTGPDTRGAELVLLDVALVEAQRRYELLAERFAALLTAAQAAVVESRSSRRDPLTPITEALRALGELPGPGVRLSDVVAESTAAWPRGVLG